MTSLITRRTMLAGAASVAATWPASAFLLEQGPDPGFALETNPFRYQPYSIQPPSTVARMAAQNRGVVLGTAAKYMGRTVGNGQCTDFVQEVLNQLKFVHKNTMWGARVDWIDHGVILQWYKAQYTSPDGNYWFGTPTQHTAIVTNWNRSTRVATVIHQNWGVQRVTKDDLNLGWTLSTHPKPEPLPDGSIIPGPGRMEVWLPWK